MANYKWIKTTGLMQRSIQNIWTSDGNLYKNMSRMISYDYTALWETV